MSSSEFRVVLEMDIYALRSAENRERLGKLIELLADNTKSDEEIHEALIKINPRGLARLAHRIDGEEMLLFPFVEQLAS